MVGIDDNPADQLIVDTEAPRAENPALQLQQDFPPQDVPRVRRTHKDDIILLLLSKLSLHENLSKNKEIEDQRTRPES